MDNIKTTIDNPESGVTRNREGKDHTSLKHAWNAQWITHPTASVLDYGVFLFRRIFELKKVPDEFIVHVSADNRYRLFVNGKEACFGPALGDITHYRYETINIAGMLRKGRNVLAAEVVNFGEYRRVAQQSYMTAFILQGGRKNAVNLDTGINKGWKVIKNEAYKAIPFTPRDLRVYYSAGPGDHCDARKYPWGWQEIDFDDSRWLEPRLANVEFAVGRGFLYGSTWFLVPRKIPFMEQTPIRFKNIVRSTGVSIPSGFVKGEKSIKIPANTKASILLDNGIHTVGFPELWIDGGINSSIKVTYAEALFIDLPNSSGNLIANDYKGNRNVTKGKRIFGVYDIFVADGGKKRLFRPLWKRTYRFVQLDIKTKDEPLIINDYYGVFVGYPFEEQAYFRSDDKTLNKIWQTAWRTLRNCADETYQDCPYYEQLQYIGDTRLQALVSIYVSGDDRLMRKAIEQFNDSRLPEGLTQSRYPAYITQVITPYSLFWISMIHDYFWYRDDPSFLEQFLPAIRDVLEWFEKRMDRTGMITGLEWWNFTDWTPQFPNGIPPGADDGYSACINLQYVYAIQQAAGLFRFYEWNYEAQKYEQIARSIQQAVKKSCFDITRGMYAETPEKQSFSQHTNIMAILTNSLPKKEQADLMRKILTDPGLIQTTLYFKFYLFRALQKTGLGSKYLEQLNPWKRMLDDGLTTFAESDFNARSDCHGWSSTPCFDLLHTVAGIYPGKPGFKEVIIAPNPGYLDFIEAGMPHPMGRIKISIKINDKKNVEGTIILPEKLQGIFIWQNKKIRLTGGEQAISLP